MVKKPAHAPTPAHRDLQIHLDPIKLTVHAKVWGDKHLPIVLALHGWQDNAATFDLLAPVLTDIQLVSIDFPGHGLSDHIGPGGNYHFVDWALVILYVADALGLNKINILAHSMGAALTSLLMASFPERFHSAVFIEAVLPFPHPTDKLISRFQEFYRKRSKLNDMHPTVFKTVDEAAKVRQQAGDMTLESAKILAERNLIEAQGGYRWRFDQRIKLPTAVGLSDDHLALIARSIMTPIMVILGDNGISLVNHQVKMMQELNQQLYGVLELPGGHHLHLDSPHLLAESINNYFFQFVKKKSNSQL